VDELEVRVAVEVMLVLAEVDVALVDNVCVVREVMVAVEVNVDVYDVYDVRLVESVCVDIVKVLDTAVTVEVAVAVFDVEDVMLDDDVLVEV